MFFSYWTTKKPKKNKAFTWFATCSNDGCVVWAHSTIQTEAKSLCFRWVCLSACLPAFLSSAVSLSLLAIALNCFYSYICTHQSTALRLLCLFIYTHATVHMSLSEVGELDLSLSSARVGVCECRRLGPDLRIASAHPPLAGLCPTLWSYAFVLWYALRLLSTTEKTRLN